MSVIVLMNVVKFTMTMILIENYLLKQSQDDIFGNNFCILYLDSIKGL